MSEETDGSRVPSAKSEGKPEVLPARVVKALQEQGVNLSDPGVRETVTILAHYFSGPIPPPELLAGYKVIDPELPGRIIGWVEQQKTHRQALERQVAEGEQRRLNRAQFNGLFVAVAGIAVSGLVGVYGDPLAAAAIVIATVGGPAATSILARYIGAAGGEKPPQSK